MIARNPVDATLHGIDEEAAFGRSLADAAGEVFLRGKRLFAGLIGNELYRPKQSGAADIADGFQAT